jgi:hypothetical protein
LPRDDESDGDAKPPPNTGTQRGET